MPLEFIPNQPVVFEHPIGTYPCLNNDDKAYGPLMQLDDEMCIQWKMTACGTPLCEPDLVLDPPVAETLGAWSVAGGWSSSSSTQLAFDGASGVGQAEQNLGTLAAGFYSVSFDVDYTAGQGTFLVRGDYQQVFGTITGPGHYTFYFPSFIAPYILQFITLDNDPSGYEIMIYNIEVNQVTSCWQDGLFNDLPSWDYTYDPLTQQGKFCARLASGSLSNLNAFINTANYHGVSLVISNCTQGGIEVYIDGGFTPIGTTSGNGQFTFYGTPNVADLIFNKVGSFDGCISQVAVNDYGVINDYLLSFESDDANVYSITSSLNAYDDRLVWCGTFGDLTWTVDGVPDLDAICGKYYTKIYDPCDNVTHTSVNLINYDPAGHDCTKFVEAWNDGYAFGFYFGDVNAPDFKLKQRLRVLAFNPVYRNSGEEYLYSSGQTVRSYAQSQKARTAWFDYADEYCHDTIRTQLLSQKLTIEGVSFYFPTEDYEPEWNDRGKYNLAQSRVTLFHELSTFGSTCGIIANPFCPPTQQACIVEEVALKMSADIASFDETLLEFYWNVMTNGTITSGGISSTLGTFNVTTAGGRSSLLTAIINLVDSTYLTASSGTITFVGTTLSINITGTISSTLPMPILSIAMIDFTAQRLSFAVSFQ